MIEEKKYPIAEIFTSPQGEGLYTGTLMTFVRFAGCTVGKPYTKDETQTLGLQIYQEKCTAWDGTEFACDTNYRATERLTAKEISSRIKAYHVCLTGGEPLMHDLKDLFSELNDTGVMVHVETSGTISLKNVWRFCSGSLHIVVSPKKGCLLEAFAECDEIKVLVGRDFNEMQFIEAFQDYLTPEDDCKVCIQPIHQGELWAEESLKTCLQLQLKYPQLRLSVQVHKLIGVL